MGKILKETRGDVQEAVDTAYYMAGEGRRMFGPTTPSELPNKFAMAVRQPIGVCGMITPWNFPMAIPSWKLLPALVCGNTCVIKPAQKTPTSFVVRELGGGTSSVVFDYRIMAKRKGYENIRLADRTRQFRKPPALTQPKTGKSVRLPSAREVREKLRARRVAQLSAPVVKH